MPIDRVPFYLNEQYASADLNTIQRIGEDALEELASYSLRAPGVDSIGNTPGFDTQPTACVLGGLNVSSTGTSLIIGPGLLSTTLNSGTDNPSTSGGYLALNPANVTIPIPSPVGDKWYVVSASPVLNDQAAVAVMTFDPPNNRPISPTPNKVKRQKVGLAFTVEAATTVNLAPPSATDAVPLYAVFRPGGGGSIATATQVVDLRPTVPLKRPMAGGNILQNQWRYTGGGVLYTSGIKITTRLQLNEVELYAATNGSPLNPSDFINPSDGAPAGGEWWYLYLARYRPLGALVVPRHAQLGLTGLAQQGLLVLSKIAPLGGDTPGARLNSAALHAAVPFNGTAIDPGDAMCFGALRRNTGNTDWLMAQCDGDHVIQLNNPIQSVADGVAVTLTGAPAAARVLDLQVVCTSALPSPGGMSITGVTALGPGTPVYQTVGNCLDTAAATVLDLSGIPVAETGLTLKFNGAGTFTWQVVVRGYRF